MRTLRSLVLVSAGTLALIVGIVSLATPTVTAQLRAALVKNVDEPGAVPFTQTFPISTSACGCTNCCFPQTAAVPAGKRLVLTNVSGFLPLNSVGNVGPITLQQFSPGPPLVVTTILSVPATFRTMWNGGDFPAWEFNSAVQAFVDAGSTCRISIFTGASWSFNTGQVTITGYLAGL